MEPPSAATRIGHAIIAVTQICVAILLGWALSKVPIPESFRGPFVIAMLAGAALYVFLLPFLKHMPKLPELPPALTRVLWLTWLAIVISSGFARGDALLVLAGGALIMCIVAVQAYRDAGRPATDLEARS